MCRITTYSKGHSVGPTENTAPDDAFAVDMLRELVATPSVSGEEARAVDLFVRRAAQLGFETEVDEAGNGHAIRRDASENGADQPIEIVLLGHIDTVPGAVPVRLDGNILHGRGSVDAKGPLVAMLIAAARAELKNDVLLRVVAAVGEETGRLRASSANRAAGTA
jgi:LysW-gamma-L-lysine carboxypeptidase